MIGEFSRLHNSLKEGLTALGHQVTLIGNGDGFKDYPVDLSTRARFSESWAGKIPRAFFYHLLGFDIATIEFGLRFYFHLKKLKGFDVVQLINESAIQTTPAFERFLLKKVIRQNDKLFLLCCGVDHTVAKFLMERKARYSIMDPYFENPKSHKEYGFILDFLSEGHKKTHDLIYENCRGVIASDVDYLLPMRGHQKFLGMIPNPVNTDKIAFSAATVQDKIEIFLGINKWTYHTKGIVFFEKALEIIKAKYADKVQVTVSENLPYREYIKHFAKAHILLDQVYAFDQGYNALEAMARGKVVFTGAEKEFTEYYQLHGKVAVNALPDVECLVAELSVLIENPDEISAIGARARAFIEKEHQYIRVAGKYLKAWEGN